MNKHKKDERKRRALVALLQAKAYYYKTGKIRGDKFFRDQNLTSINKAIIHDIAERDITDEYVAEVLARDYAYKHKMKKTQREEMAARAAEAEKRWQETTQNPAFVSSVDIGHGESVAGKTAPREESPAIAPQTGAESPQDAKPMDCPPEEQNAVERGIFDIDEQTCIEFLKSRGWKFVATKAI